jgi:hypothetical protein
MYTDLYLATENVWNHLRPAGILSQAKDATFTDARE